MSRSRKKNPIHGITTCESEKKDKKIWHGKMRAAERDRLINDPESVTTIANDVCQKYAMGKDGKTYSPQWDKVYRK